MSGSAGRATARPARGTRPANRRELIVAAAADLFYRHGYANVSMSDIASAVAIGPSALYRHFTGKQELLATVVQNGLDSMHDALERAGHNQPSTLAAALAPAMISHREAGVLWRREARVLDGPVRDALRQKLLEIWALVFGLLKKERPSLPQEDAGLLGWCVLGVATSISFHQLQLPEPEFTELVTSMIDAAATASPPSLPTVTPLDVGDPSESGAEWRPTLSRREELIAVATRLFAERGYASVGMEDVGAAVGIAGPSIYNHFTSKAELLAAATNRGADWLHMDLVRELSRSAGPVDGLRRLLNSYGEFAMEQRHLVDLLITEVDQLPDDERRRTRRTQITYIAGWVQLLTEVHPDMDPVTARIRVQAALSMINDAALTPHLRRIPGIVDALVVIGSDLLEL